MNNQVAEEPIIDISNLAQALKDCDQSLKAYQKDNKNEDKRSRLAHQLHDIATFSNHFSDIKNQQQPKQAVVRKSDPKNQQIGVLGMVAILLIAYIIIDKTVLFNSTLQKHCVIPIQDDVKQDSELVVRYLLSRTNYEYTSAMVDNLKKNFEDSIKDLDRIGRKIQKFEPFFADSSLKFDQSLLKDRVIDWNAVESFNTLVQNQREKLGTFDFGDESISPYVEFKGMVEYPDGTKYFGYCQKGTTIREGKGVSLFKNGRIDEGWWQNDMKNGTGRQIFEEGSYYIGSFLNDKKTGEGSYYYQSGQWKGDKYIGEWRNDKKEGYGVYIHANGDRYAGYWKFDQFSGEGTYTFASGNRFEGQWVTDQKNGKGVFYYANGDFYKGVWKNDKREGEGILILSSGQRIPQVYENGQLKVDKEENGDQQSNNKKTNDNS